MKDLTIEGVRDVGAVRVRRPGKTIKEGVDVPDSILDRVAVRALFVHECREPRPKRRARAGTRCDNRRCRLKRARTCSPNCGEGRELRVRTTRRRNTVQIFRYRCDVWARPLDYGRQIRDAALKAGERNSENKAAAACAAACRVGSVVPSHLRLPRLAFSRLQIRPARQRDVRVGSRVGKGAERERRSVKTSWQRRASRHTSLHGAQNGALVSALPRTYGEFGDGDTTARAVARICGLLIRCIISGWNKNRLPLRN